MYFLCANYTMRDDLIDVIGYIDQEKYNAFIEKFLEVFEPEVKTIKKQIESKFADAYVEIIRSSKKAYEFKENDFRICKEDFLMNLIDY